MFTGLVEETGRVLLLEETAGAWRLQVSASRTQRDMAIGDSIAVNGCCLTVTAFDSATITFELIEETVRLTTFEEVRKAGRMDRAAGMDEGVMATFPADIDTQVNLEGSLRMNGKIGGHFVTGHIDSTGRVDVIERRGKDTYLRVVPPSDMMRYLTYKGSVAINGVSLTIAEVDEEGFVVWLIPHTLTVTNLRDLRPGGGVNLEFDLLGKYVETLLGRVER
jgi:riboflavin synthase